MSQNRHGYFIVQEFIPPEIYNQMGDKSINLMDVRMIETANSLRAYFGVMYINTWAFEGKYRYRGLRPNNLTSDPITGTKFARKGEHYFGNAEDFHFKEVTIEEAFNEIINNRHLFPHIHRLEGNPTTWIHADCKGDPHEIITIF
jgi:hypothetical protein